MVPRKRRAAVFSFSSPSFRSAFPPPFSSSSLPQVQILVRVPAAERQKQEQKEGDTKKPHFELLEGCRPETTVADLKRQVEFFFFFFLLSPFGVFLFLFTFSLPNGDALSRSLHLSLFLFLSLSLPFSLKPQTDRGERVLLGKLRPPPEAPAPLPRGPRARGRRGDAARPRARGGVRGAGGRVCGV